MTNTRTPIRTTRITLGAAALVLGSAVLTGCSSGPNPTCGEWDALSVDEKISTATELNDGEESDAAILALGIEGGCIDADDDSVQIQDIDYEDVDPGSLDQSQIDPDLLARATGS